MNLVLVILTICIMYELYIYKLWRQAQSLQIVARYYFATYFIMFHIHNTLILCLNRCGTMTGKNLFIPSFIFGNTEEIQKGEIVGRGERKIFHQVIIWMSHHKLPELIRILPHIPNYGYWKDLLVLMGTPAETDVVKLFGDQLIRDYISYHSHIPGLISMAAKWTPNERSSSDIRHNTYGKIARHMKVSRKILRKQYLVPLRQYLPVTEQMVSAKQWSFDKL
jgi:hypothetical protein